MKKLSGNAISGGAAAGTAYVFAHAPERIRKAGPTSGEEETKRLEAAIEAAKEGLSALCARSEAEAAEILGVQLLMLDDDDILDSLRDCVSGRGMTAEAAVAETEKRFVSMLLETGDEYMQARAADVKDVSIRLLDCLSEGDGEKMPDAPFVLVTDELLPGDIARFENAGLAAVVTGSCPKNSHAAILLRAKRIPAVSGIGTDGIGTGTRIAVDGNGGTVLTGADDAEETAFLAEANKKSRGFALFGGRDGIPVYANVGSAAEADVELFEKCSGIGLFRTEFLCFGRSTPPDEEEQYEVYKAVLENSGGKSVTVRTFDLGADKAAESVPLPKEENPALGCRGLRVYKEYPELFDTQIRALLRAAVYGELRIMYPMVTSRKELAELKARVAEIEDGLRAEKIPFGNVKQGAMIETPAAAILSGELAELSDFFSVGTNDLTQYTLALDRQNGRLDGFADGENRAVLELIRLTVANAHARGIPVSVCGELAAEPALYEKWLTLGIDGLSVSSGYFGK